MKAAKELIYREEKGRFEMYKEVHNTNFHAVDISGGSELVDIINESQTSTVTVESAYNPDGEYIGDEERALYLCVEKGIAPVLSGIGHKVCSIGFCDKEQKWYGWSHRAIYGFGIGDEVKEGDCTASSGYTEEYTKEHPEKDRSLSVGFVAKNINDAKRMAMAFADSVS